MSECTTSATNDLFMKKHATCNTTGMALSLTSRPDLASVVHDATNAMATAESFMYHISLDQQANSSAVHALQALTRGLHQTHPPIQDLHTSTPNTNPLNYRQRAEWRTTGVRHKAHKTIKSVDAQRYVRAAHHKSIVRRRLESTCSALFLLSRQTCWQ